MDDAFKKAQKPWAKLLQKVEKAKTDYHTACKTEKSAANQERNAAGDSSFSADQVQNKFFFILQKLFALKTGKALVCLSKIVFRSNEL